jgi:hypothetical protein
MTLNRRPMPSSPWIPSPFGAWSPACAKPGQLHPVATSWLVGAQDVRNLAEVAPWQGFGSSGARDRARTGESTRCGLIGHPRPHVGNVAGVRENKEFSGHYDCTRMHATPASKALCASLSLRGAVGHAGITRLSPSPFGSPSRSEEDARCREVNTRPLNCLSS